MKWQITASRGKSGMAETRSVEAKIGRLKICVTRHMDYDPTAWILVCDALIDSRVLESLDLESAKVEAALWVRSQLMAALDALDAP